MPWGRLRPDRIEQQPTGRSAVSASRIARTSCDTWDLRTRSHDPICEESFTLRSDASIDHRGLGRRGKVFLERWQILVLNPALCRDPAGAKIRSCAGVYARARDGGKSKLAAAFSMIFACWLMMLMYGDAAGTPGSSAPIVARVLIRTSNPTLP